MASLIDTSPPDGERILLRGGYLITVDDGLGELQGDLLIANGKIGEIAPRIDASDLHVIDASGYLVLPGFVDSHRHTWQTTMRSIGTDWDLSRIMGDLFRHFGPRFGPDDVYAAALFGRLSALDSGVTTLLDWAHIQNTPDHADEGIRALREAGGRSVFAHGQPGKDPKTWMFGSDRPHPTDIRRVREKLLSSDDGLVTMAMACRGPEFTAMEAVDHDVRLARELGLRVTIHIGLGENGAKVRGIERMHEKDLLGPDITFVHCCTSSDREFELMAETGTTAAVSVQMAMMADGFGMPATGRMLARGVRPSLSVDSEMTASGDMFSEMRAALNLERAVHHHGLESPPRTRQLTTRDVLELATIEGARAVGLADRVGSLTPGKSADLILIPRNALNLAPIGDPVGALVVGGHGGNVEAVLVEGRPVKWGGRMLSCDPGRALELIGRSREQLFEGLAE